MKTVALLPMKINSERVPGKNFKLFAGKPLFQWILDTLLTVEGIDEVVINTDAEALLKANGLEQSDRVIIRERRPEICGDHVSMNLIIQDDVAAVTADQYVMTHTTNPLLSATTIERGLTKFLMMRSQSAADSLFGVTKHQTRFYDSAVKPINHNPEELIRTQDLEPWFEENSCIYIFSAASFYTTNARIGQKPALFEVPKLEAIDIDDEDDWHIAAAIATAAQAQEATDA